MTRGLDLGIFLPNAKGGAIMATGELPQYAPTWALNTKNALIAEAAGFDFLLSMVKWRGFGGLTEHRDHSLESFSPMSAVAAVTSRIELYASVAIPTIHPAVIAKMTATIDDISDGRFGVDIVSGWNKFEYLQMGLWRGDDYFDYRYDYAAEYLEVPFARARLLEGFVISLAANRRLCGPFEHDGEEVGYVLEGELKLIVGGKPYLIAQGGSFFFRSDLPHFYGANGRRACRVIWVNTPPTF
jgi:alkanesulfonate monooxygenase SsuD/methylene tetrahydromethanopterin reductase-like flavin-dependent oxidoreductase (luciferase family)